MTSDQVCEHIMKAPKTKKVLSRQRAFERTGKVDERTLSMSFRVMEA